MSLLRIEWAAGADTRNLRHTAAQLLQLDQQLGMRNMLLDMHTFPDISVYDQVWLGTNWMPGIVKLPLERVVLVNPPRRVHNQLAIDSLIALVRPFIKFDIQFFANSDSALQWLSDRSPRVAELQAEWKAVHGPDLPIPTGVAEPRLAYRA